MSNSLKYTFLVFTIVCIIIGVPLLLAPGRFLGLFGWAPVEPLIDRMFGAVLIGLAWAALRASLQSNREKVQILIEANAIFCTLSLVGLVRHLLIAHYAFMVWFVAALYAIFAVLWIIHWVRK
jgi:hypothetical protein